jgi:type II secretory pathway pseudopilin PulG
MVMAPPRTLRTSRRSSEGGYSLVVLVVAVTVLNILVAAMLPLWSTAIKREKEEELVFRGFQYAEAIRVYHQRYQSYPTKLEQLLEVKPRCIRQLWKDPMTEDGKWGLIFQNQPQGPLRGHLDSPDGQPSDPNGRPKPDEDENQENQGGDDGPQLGVRKGEQVQVGPIIGVRSKSGEKSKLILFGRERYDEWQFTETQLMGNTQPINVGGAGVPPPPGGLTFSTRWLGRPMRGIDQQPATGLPQDGTLPNGQGPGLNGPKPSRPRQSQPGGTSKPRGLP